MNKDQALEILIDNLILRVKPVAERLDHDSKLLKQEFLALGEKKLLALQAAENFGGLNLSSLDLFGFSEQLARFSGALRFLVAQQQTAANLISRAECKNFNTDIFVNNLATGEYSVGISIYYLRTPEKKAVRGEVKNNKFVLNGEARWVSGYNILDNLVIGFFLPDNHEALALVPFKSQLGISISPIIKTISNSSVNTVGIKFENYEILEKNIICIKKPNSFKNSKISLAQHIPAYTGLALGVLDIIKNHDNLAYEKLNNKISLFREKIFENKEYFHNEVHMRKHASNLCLSFLESALWLVGGSSVLVSRPVERMWREFVQASVSGLSKKSGIELVHCGE